MGDLLPVRRSDRTPARRDEGWMEPRDSYREFEDAWDRLVSRFFGAPWSGLAWPQTWTPSVDVEETDNAWTFEVDLPGASRDDIQIEVGDADLTIRGEMKEKERVGVMRHRTRRTGSFFYRTTLPSGVDPDGVEATFDNGVLTVSVPRPEQSRPRRVKIV